MRIEFTFFFSGDIENAIAENHAEDNEEDESDDESAGTGSDNDSIEFTNSTLTLPQKRSKEN
jgi:hypothetical protein